MTIIGWHAAFIHSFFTLHIFPNAFECFHSWNDHETINRQMIFKRKKEKKTNIDLHLNALRSTELIGIQISIQTNKQSKKFKLIQKCSWQDEETLKAYYGFGLIQTWPPIYKWRQGIAKGKGKWDFKFNKTQFRQIKWPRSVSGISTGTKTITA